MPTKLRSERQHTTPMLFDRLNRTEKPHALKRIKLGSECAESWLRDTLYSFPQLLPVGEIEPAFGSLIPVCTELPMPAGRADNFFITEDGNLVIVECKLWRNPEARREVVAQIIDYAQSMTSWSYEELENKIRSGRRPDDKKLTGLFSLVSENEELDEQAFIKAVSQNLRRGYILLLIVGDGIADGVETLVDSLQKHAGFHFRLWLVEMAIFEMPSGEHLVQPRIVARTVNIERGIVKVVDGQISVEPSPGAGIVASETMSEELLLEELAKNAPKTATTLKEFKAAATELGVSVEAAAKSLQVRWTGPDEVDYALGGITPNGKLKTRNVNWKPYDIDRTDLSHEYLSRVAALIGARVHQTTKPQSWYIEGTRDRLPDAIDLLSKQREWLEIIRWYTDELAGAIEENPERNA